MIITYWAINLLDRKFFGENMALKVDIRKAFDTRLEFSHPGIELVRF